MLIVALVLAVIGLAALVTAVVTSNEVIAWVCIGASVLGVLLLIVDAVRDRSGRRAGAETEPDSGPEGGEEQPQDGVDQAEFDAEYPDDSSESYGVEGLEAERPADHSADADSADADSPGEDSAAADDAEEQADETTAEDRPR